MLKEVSGDILLSGAQLIAHGVAPNDDFHQGLALDLRKHMPAMYKDFRHYCQVSHPKAGKIWAWSSEDDRLIVNLLTQEAAYGHGAKPGKATTAYVNSTLKELHKLIEKKNIQSVALPRIATGVGGLDWDDVYPLIEKQLGRLPIPIYVYTTFNKGEKATE